MWMCFSPEPHWPWWNPPCLCNHSPEPGAGSHPQDGFGHWICLCCSWGAETSVCRHPLRVVLGSTGHCKACWKSHGPKWGGKGAEVIHNTRFAGSPLWTPKSSCGTNHLKGYRCINPWFCLHATCVTYQNQLCSSETNLIRHGDASVQTEASVKHILNQT